MVREKFISSYCNAKDKEQKILRDQELTELPSLITEAVRPAADEPFPEV